MFRRRSAATKRIHDEAFKKGSNYTPPITNFQVDKIQITWADLEKGIQDVYAMSVNDAATAIPAKRYAELYNQTFTYYTEAMNQDIQNCGLNNQQNVKRIIARSQEADSHGILSSLNAFLANYLEEQLKNLGNENVFEEYIKLFKNFSFSSKVVAGIFGYFNRIKMTRSKVAIRPTYLLAMQNWKVNLFSKHGQLVRDSLVKLIADNRKGHPASEEVIVYGIKSFLQLDLVPGTVELYPSLERQIIEDAEEYYTTFFQENMSYLAVPEYMRKVELCMGEECVRSKTFFPAATQLSMMGVCKKTLIMPQLDSIRKEFGPLLIDNRVDDLRRLYNLISRVDTLEKGIMLGLSQEFQQHVGTFGAAAVQPSSTREEPIEYFNALMSVYKKFQTLVTASFNSDQIFRTALDRACLEFVNNNGVTLGNANKAACLLAKYTNSLLQLRSAENMEDRMNDFICILKFIREKDAFQQHYSMFLANRLTRCKSSSQEWEESMVSKLALAELGDYVHKIRTMFKDLVKSEVMAAEFEVLARENEPIPFDFPVKILTTGHWPYTQDVQEFECPALLKIVQVKFVGYYNEKWSGRKLTWLVNRSQGEVKYHPPNSNSCYWIVVSTYQMAILLMYNDEDSIQIHTMMERTRMSFEFLTQILTLLLRCKLLVKAVPNDDLTPDSFVQIYMRYKNSKTRFDISAPTQSETQQQVDRVDRQISESRRFVIKATIVRIMKMEKSMKHVILLTQVIDAVKDKFSPSVRDIRGCIDDLLDNDYIQRRACEQDRYDYVS